MSPKVVLITGVAGDLGGRLLARLSADPGLERVIGVDTAPPRRTGAPPRDTGAARPAGPAPGDVDRAEFVRLDIRDPLVAKVITSAKVDTVVHVGAACRPAAPGRRAARKEVNVIGTMRLLAACQRSPHVRRLVVASTAAVYGASPRSQAVFTEDSELIPDDARGYAKDAVEVEGYVRGFARRRPDVTVTTARLADIVGGGFDTVFARYLGLPVVPTAFGFDARLQLLHAEDAVAVLERAALTDRPGVVNVGGDGVLTVSQAVRRAGRVELPVPRTALPSFGAVLRGARTVDLSPENARLLSFGRVLDTTRLRREFGYTPRWTTREALDDHLRDHPPVPGSDVFVRMLDAADRRRTVL